MDCGMFRDVEWTKWYMAYVAKAVDSGIMEGDGRGHFRPEEPLTRAEAAVIVCRLLEKIADEL